MTRLTVLNSMASADFSESIEIQKSWGIRDLDLRDAILGESINDLSQPTAERVRKAIDGSGLEVTCLSSTFFKEDLSKGQDHFVEQHLRKLDSVLAAAQILRPRFFRLIAASLPVDGNGRRLALLEHELAWVVDLYREAVDRIAEAGLRTTIENEAPNSIFTHDDDIIGFFELLDRPETASFTWDIQNQWACGVFPSIEGFERLKNLIGYVHVKGGQAEPSGRDLVWAASLEDSDWPVRTIVQAVVDSGISPVICLNRPSHGRPKPGYDYEALTKRDIDFLRSEIIGIE